MVTRQEHEQLKQHVNEVLRQVDDIHGARHDELMLQFAQTNDMISGMASKAELGELRSEMRAGFADVLSRLP